MYILKMADMGLMLHHIYGLVNQLKAIIFIFAIYMYCSNEALKINISSNRILYQIYGLRAIF